MCYAPSGFPRGFKVVLGKGLESSRKCLLNADLGDCCPLVSTWDFKEATVIAPSGHFFVINCHKGINSFSI